MSQDVTTPTAAEVRAMRAAAGLTQTQAAALIYKKLRAWQQYEAGDRPMDRAYRDLFQRKAREIP